MIDIQLPQYSRTTGIYIVCKNVKALSATTYATTAMIRTYHMQSTFTTTPGDRNTYKFVAVPVLGRQQPTQLLKRQKKNIVRIILATSTLRLHQDPNESMCSLMEKVN